MNILKGIFKPHEPNFEELCNDIKLGGWELKKRAIIALGNLGDPRAVDLLIAVLKGSGADHRWEATKALGKIGDMRAIEPLGAILENPNSASISAQEALDALSMFDHPSIVKYYIAALKNEFCDVRFRAAVIISKKKSQWTRTLFPGLLLPRMIGVKPSNLEIKSWSL
jgi:HEAT repeat protein